MSVDMRVCVMYESAYSESQTAAFTARHRSRYRGGRMGAVRRASGLELELLVLARTPRGAAAESSLKEDRLSTLGAALALRTSDASCKEHRQV